MNRLSFVAVLGAMAALALSQPVLADTAAPRSITVSGEGRVAATPDMATLQLGVNREAETAAEALAEASEAAAAVLARIEAMGIEPRDVQTSALSLHPRWDHRPEREGGQRIIGYTAGTSLQVRLRDLSMLGALLDGTVGDGANQFGGLRLDIADPEALRAEARASAVADGQRRAGQLAEAAGATLGAVQRISEASTGDMRPPMPMMRAEMAMDSAMPLAQGEVEITVQVQMVFAIED